MLRAELRKIWRPALLWSAGLALGSSLVFVSIYQSGAHWQYNYARDGLNGIENVAMEDYCASIGLSTGPDCDSTHRQELREWRLYMAETTTRYRLGAALQHPLGSLGAAAGLISSIAGLVAVAAIAAAHVGGEWSTGTVYSVLARDPRRRRFVLRKFVSVWLTGVGVVVAAWVSLALLGPVFRAFYDVPPAAPGFSMWEFAVPAFLKAMLVLAAFSALGTLAGIVAHHSLGALGLTGALLAASVIIPAIAGGRTDWSFPYLVSEWMGFDSVDALANHVWMSVDVTAGDAWLGGMAGLSLLVAVALSLASIRMATSDLRTE